MLAPPSRYWTNVGWVLQEIKRIERLCLRSWQRMLGEVTAQEL
jgi:hypothetical protein